MSAESGWLRKNKIFRERIKQNRKIVKSWPQWMQNIVISAETVMTGKFIKDKK